MQISVLLIILSKEAQVDKEITFRDARYFNLLNTRAIQMPLKHIYNHEPIYGSYAKVSYTDEEFEKYIYFDVARGQALNELHLSYNMMNKSKWRTLAKAIEWQKNNYDILQNAMFIGGNPEENNIYGYFSWNDNGDGIIALRNPTDEKTSLTLTLNKLMGCPESLKDVKRYNVYNQSNKESFDSFPTATRLTWLFSRLKLRFSNSAVRINVILIVRLLRISLFRLTTRARKILKLPIMTTLTFQSLRDM